VTRVAIVDSVRTGISRAFQGRLRAARPDDMAAHCVDALFARNPWLAGARIDDCAIGCAFPEGPQGMNLGRNVAVLSRLGRDTAGLTISRYCASGLDAVAHAAARIASGQAEVVVAGGVESISMTMKSVNAHHLFNPAIRDRSPGTYVHMSWDNPAIPFWKRAFRTMGETAEIIAEQRGIARAAQDACAWQSQQRTAQAQDAGVFRDEIVPLAVAIEDPVTGAIEHAIVDRDDCNRPDTALETLATLQPAFRPDGSVTAGNAAPAADGAACMVLASEEVARRERLAVLGWFTGYATVGCEPELMAAGAVRAIKKLCAAHRLAPGDIDVFEINEVFALGHPFGMTGARLVGHAARELGRRGQRRAVVAMCVGGGVGAAALIEVPAT
jgi:acetyl-CoA acyltransferase